MLEDDYRVAQGLLGVTACVEIAGRTLGVGARVAGRDVMLVQALGGLGHGLRHAVESGQERDYRVAQRLGSHRLVNGLHGLLRGLLGEEARPLAMATALGVGRGREI